MKGEITMMGDNLLQSNTLLHGVWRFYIGGDVKDHNINNLEFTNTIQIPGILQAQGYGSDISLTTPWVSSLHDTLWYERQEYKTEDGEVNIPFLSQPPKHYLGCAWYQKKFMIPKNREEDIYYFEIECVKWKTSVWIDHNYIGSEVGLCTPHSYCLGVIKEGEHTITVCVDNSFQSPYRPDGHMVSDALGASWNGMVGSVTLKSVPAVHIENIVVFPETSTRNVVVRVILRNYTKESQEVQIQLNEVSSFIVMKEELDTFEFNISYSDETPLWDEYEPHVNHLLVKLLWNQRKQEKEVTFGFRHIEAKNGLFLLNNRPTFFRGTHFGGDFPLTGYPSVEVDDWKRIIRICKNWGLNYIRFHSFCPPKAAFLAADEEGMYLQVECGMWNKFYENCNMNDILWEETKKILDTFGNHPSFVMLSPSNEPGNDWYQPLTKWVEKCKDKDCRRIYTTQSGWPYPVEPKEIDGTDYVYFHRSGFGIEPGGTIRNSQGWHGKDYYLSVKGIKYPVISHELGQWCSYPNYDVIDKFTGYLKPGNYKVFRESARRHGVLQLNKKFAYLSGKLKVQLYKEDVEATFRTPHIYGFELLDLHDYIGQGTAQVGMLDAFWEEQGFVTSKEFQRFCSETVPLLRLSKRVYQSEECLDCLVEVCHFGREEIKGAIVKWEICDDNGTIVRMGEFPSQDLQIKKNIEIGRLQVNFEDFLTPAHYEIVVGIKGTTIKNSWGIWVYHFEEDRKEEVSNEVQKECINHSFKNEPFLYTNDLEETIFALRNGKRVLYSPLPEHQRLDSPPLSVKSVFWNAQMGPTYARGMGLMIKNEHSALRLFPTNEYQEWQWEDIIAGAYGINLCEFPKELEPIVRPIDDYTRNYNLGMIIECKVGSGALLIVSADIDQNLEKRPAAKQLRKALFAYVASSDFSPNVTISEEVLIRAFSSRNIMLENNAKVRLISYDKEIENSEEESFYEACIQELNKICDGNPNTFYTSHLLKYPFTLEIEIEKELAIKGLIYMPRQNEREHKGDICGCRIEAFMNGRWLVVFDGELESSYEPKHIMFSQEVTTSKVRFLALYGFFAKGIHSYIETDDGWIGKSYDYEDTTAAIAELLFIPAGNPLPFMKSLGKNKDISNVPKSEQYLSKSATVEIDN